MKLFKLLLVISLLSTSCGLKYTPTETREDLAVTRKTNVEKYIRDSYKDSSIVYQPLQFGQTTIVKPYNHRRLDSLYQLKYDNEMSGRYDKQLEEKINNQKIIVSSSNEKLRYIEHHVYNMQTPDEANVYYADIMCDHTSAVINFTITDNYQFPSTLIPIFKSYLTNESLVYPNYQPTSDENTFYLFFGEALGRQSIANKNEFMSHMLTIFLLARNIKSLDTKLLLQHFSLINVEGRQYSSQVDKFESIEGIYENNVLMQYEVKFTTPIGKFILLYSPYFEVISMTKI